MLDWVNRDGEIVGETKEKEGGVVEKNGDGLG